MEKRTRRYDGVIFDLDGTLLDTLDDLTDSLNAVLRQYQYSEYSRDEVKGFVGNGIRKLIERAIPNGCSNPKYEAVHQTFLQYYGEHCMDKTAPYPGVISLLEALKKEQYGLAIVSNKADFAVKKLNHLYFGERIRTAIGAKDGIRKKPAPDMVFQALKELGMEADRVVYVGDSDVDIETAKNAGMDAIAVVWGFRSKEFLLVHGAQERNLAESAEELKDMIETGK